MLTVSSLLSWCAFTLIWLFSAVCFQRGFKFRQAGQWVLGARTITEEQLAFLLIATPDNNYSHYSEHLGFRYQYKTLSAPETIAIWDWEAKKHTQQYWWLEPLLFQLNVLFQLRMIFGKTQDFWKNSGFCPNRLDTPPPKVGTQKKLKKVVYKAF